MVHSGAAYLLLVGTFLVSPLLLQKPWAFLWQQCQLLVPWLPRSTHWTSLCTQDLAYHLCPLVEHATHCHSPLGTHREEPSFFLSFLLSCSWANQSDSFVVLPPPPLPLFLFPFLFLSPPHTPQPRCCGPSAPAWMAPSQDLQARARAPPPRPGPQLPANLFCSPGSEPAPLACRFPPASLGI